MAECQDSLVLPDGYMGFHAITLVMLFGNTAKEMLLKTDQFVCKYFVKASTQKC